MVYIEGFEGRDFLTFVSPPISPEPIVFALIKPFTFLTWLSVIVSVLIMGAVFWRVSIIESNTLGLEIVDWATLKKSLWYCFGTMVGESLTRDTNTNGAWGIR